jgi:hypothetical protein
MTNIRDDQAILNKAVKTVDDEKVVKLTKENGYIINNLFENEL